MLSPSSWLNDAAGRCTGPVEYGSKPENLFLPDLFQLECVVMFCGGAVPETAVSLSEQQLM